MERHSSTEDPQRIWEEADHPTQLLQVLTDGVSERKYRLLLCAAVRRLLPLLLDPRSQRALETIERFADGQALLVEHEAVSAPAFEAYNDARANGYDPAVANAAYCITYRSPPDTGRQVAQAVLKDCQDACERNQHLGFDPELERAVHCRLLRCVFGHPFRPVNLDRKAMLAWNNGTVHQLACMIYEGQGFDVLPILADALEEAGCPDQTILDHCRDEGPHVRGCWVVDLLLGKS
jgi:hypothetical protein